MSTTPAPNAGLQVPGRNPLHVPGGRSLQWHATQLYQFSVKFLEDHHDGRDYTASMTMAKPPDPSIWVHRAVVENIPRAQWDELKDIMEARWGLPDRGSPTALWCSHWTNVSSPGRLTIWFKDPELHAEFSLRYC